MSSGTAARRRRETVRARARSTNSAHRRSSAPRVSAAAGPRPECATPSRGGASAQRARDRAGERQPLVGVSPGSLAKYDPEKGVKAIAFLDMAEKFEATPGVRRMRRCECWTERRHFQSDEDSDTLRLTSTRSIAACAKVARFKR